ncbi:MAG: bifunctional folylpolyglutamate synthase/dihydrofolate synthase [Rikenellaceae bacterium]|nr:bifunctional folylpolyglutamate synthase/dihydrofolate synthase [Rikenellaceae bacterium]
MDYKETLETLYNMLPDFQKVGADAYKPGLERITDFSAALGNPHLKYRIIHVAGTNGKGSVSHMLASVLTAAGYRTGLYTSPHLRDFRERIRIDGEMIPERAVTDFTGKWMEEMRRFGLSFFEATAAMAFDYFASGEVDFAVIETGLGGRLDATNIVTPLLSIITNIGLDHTDLLGGTAADIAGEKAGIIKPGVPVVIGEKQEETERVFRDTALLGGSPIIFAEEQYHYLGRERTGVRRNGAGEAATPLEYAGITEKSADTGAGRAAGTKGMDSGGEAKSLRWGAKNAEESHPVSARAYGSEGKSAKLWNGAEWECETVNYRIQDLRDGSVGIYPCDLTGIYQRRNIVTVLSAVDILRRKYGVELPAEAVTRGLATAALSTGLEGRWQVLGRSPLVVCDTGHNAHGISQVVDQIRGERFARLYMVIGFVRDKDLSSILPLLPKDAYYIFTNPSIRRALPAGELAALAAAHGLGGRVCPTVPEAVERALSLAGKDDMVFIGGSTFVVADLLDTV